MIEKTVLHSGWTLSCNDTARRGLPETIPATVPGCVHLDLLANRLIPDPYIDVNEITNDWIGRTDWTYRCTFELRRMSAQCRSSSSTGSIRSR